MVALPGPSTSWIERSGGETTISYSKGIGNSSLALWPPKVSSKWKLYALYGAGGRQDSGRWNLVDEHGQSGRVF